MRATAVLLLVTVALVGATGGVAAADGQSGESVEVTERPNGLTESPPWPDEETTTGNDSAGGDANADTPEEDTPEDNRAQDSPEGDAPDEDTSEEGTPAGEDTPTEENAPGGQNTPEEDSADQNSADQNTPSDQNSPDDQNSPNDDTERETTSVSPGQQLAGAVGAQGASVQGELWNRTLSERLADASSADARAEVVADEVETIETYLDALEGVRSNVTGAWESGRMSEGEYRAALSEFVVRAYSVERRANQTLRAAERLPAGVRDRHDIDLTHVRSLADRAHALYQFEDPIAQQVANETLSNQSALTAVLPEDARTDQNRTRTGE